MLQDRFRSLFTPAEVQTANERLERYNKEAVHRQSERERLYPDELDPGLKYTEGAKKTIRVNAYERSREARSACLTQHGYRCAVCDLLFEERYGSLGRSFIHVHHLKPLALTDSAYELDPIADLRPVCPNCHAMLHHGENRVLSIEELKEEMERAASKAT